MSIRIIAIAIVLVAAGLLEWQQSDKSIQATTEVKPLTTEKIEGTDLNLIRLTDKAAKRLDIQTEEISQVEANGKTQTVMPYAAIIYDTEGKTWTYVSLEPLAFVRESITVDRIDGDKAVIVQGPPPGARVVTVGAAELYGSETEFAEE